MASGDYRNWVNKTIQMKILLLGKGGQVGWELQRSLAVLGDLFAYDHPEIDFSQPETLRELVQKIQPDFIVNSAAYTAVDKAESDVETARLVNAESVKVLAEEAKIINAWVNSLLNRLCV